MKKKFFAITLIFTLSITLFGCGQNQNNTRYQVYNTDYKGIATTTYPVKVLTDYDILKAIDAYKSNTKIKVERLEVKCLVKFYDEEGHLNTFMIMNNGQISLMKDALKQAEYIVTAKGLNAILDKIEK